MLSVLHLIVFAVFKVFDRFMKIFREPVAAQQKGLNYSFPKMERSRLRLENKSMDLLFVVLFAGVVALILALLIALKILSREVEDKGMVKFSPKL